MASPVHRLELFSIRWGNDLSLLADQVRRATVEVRCATPGAGSGVVWSPDGLIVTNAHVARSGRLEVALSDGRRYPAEVVARDERADLAALRVDCVSLPSMIVRDAESLHSGELVVAVGHPWGEIGAVSVGLVHHTRDLKQWIVSDLRLAPGNSGGPLVDAEGRLVGINSMIVNGFAISIATNAVSKFLREQGTSAREWKRTA